MHVTSAETTELFAGSAETPLQLVRVAYTGASPGETVRVTGEGLSGEAAAEPGDGVVEVPVAVTGAVPGETRTARAADVAFEFTVAEPGWTMYMISHFHYDP
ncbi:hypothetical protein, partial [Mycolicibacterium sp.]